MNAFNACSLNYVAIQGKLIQAALLLLRALSHINVYDTDGQNAVENHLANNMFVNKKLIKLLVIVGEKIATAILSEDPYHEFVDRKVKAE